MRKVLTNPIYLGKIRHDGEIYEGSYEAVLDEDTWNRAAAARESAAAIRRTPNAKGNMRGSAPGGNNGGGRWPRGEHVMVKGLLRCGHCGSAMTPHTDRSRRNGNYQVYKCRGRCDFGIGYCPQGVVDRATVDEAILTELSKRYLDLDETRRRLREKREADAALAGEALASAERELSRADAALVRIERDYIEGKIAAEKWNRLEATLSAERDAAALAVERIQSHTIEVADSEVEEETLRRLAELREGVLHGLQNPPDLNALRTLLRQLFAQVVYWPSSEWGEMLSVPTTTQGSNVAPHVPTHQAVLLPILKRDAIAGWEGDPLDSLPIIRKAALTLDVPERLSQRPLGLPHGADEPGVTPRLPNSRMSARYSENDGLAL